MKTKAQATVSVLFGFGAIFLAMGTVLFLDAYKNIYLGQNSSLVIIELLLGAVLVIAALVGFYLMRK